MRVLNRLLVADAQQLLQLRSACCVPDSANVNACFSEMRMLAASLSLIGITMKISCVCGFMGRIMAEPNAACADFT